MDALRSLRVFAFAVVAFAATAGGAWAQKRIPESVVDPGLFRIDENKFLGNKLDKGIKLKDADGRPFVFGDMFAPGKPVILVLSYYVCDGTCTAVNADLATQLKGVTGWAVGRDFRILTVSFDPNDTLETMAAFHQTLGLPESWREGWTFSLPETGDEARRLADSVGFKYFWSPRDRTFLHPGAYVILSPEGRVVRYLYSTNSRPLDVELALTDAKANQIRPSEIVNYAVALCYSYNYAEGRYTLNIPMFVGFGAVTIGITIFTISVFAYKRRIKGEAVR